MQIVTGIATAGGTLSAGTELFAIKKILKIKTDLKFQRVVPML